MIPIVAAASVFSTIDRVLSGSSAGTTHPATTAHGSGKNGGASGSFAAMLAQITGK